MKLEQAILTRRSIRSFTDDHVTDEQLMEIIRCGQMAPSLRDAHQMGYIIVRDLEVKRALMSATRVGTREKNPPQKFIATADAIIALYMPLTAMMKLGGRKAVDMYMYLETGALVQNMLLKCHDMGLGTCYIVGFREREAAKAVGLNEEYELVALLPVGHPAMKGVKRPDTPFDSIVQMEKFPEMTE